MNRIKSDAKYRKAEKQTRLICQIPMRIRHIEQTTSSVVSLGNLFTSAAAMGRFSLSRMTAMESLKRLMARSKCTLCLCVFVRSSLCFFSSFLMAASCLHETRSYIILEGMSHYLYLLPGFASKMCDKSAVFLM